jgi:hypothetical protein
MQTQGKLRATRTTMVTMWRFERISCGARGIATSSTGRAAIPEGDQSNIRVVTIQRAAPLSIDGFVSLINRTANAITRGNRAALVIKPMVPYLSAQRNQNNPEHNERVVAKAAEITGSPTILAARNTQAGARAHMIPHIIIGYAVSTGKR